MSKVTKTAAEYVSALRRITSTPVLLTQPKQIYSDILGEAVTHIPSMSAGELRSFSKSVLVVNNRFSVDQNNYLFKLVNKQLLALIDNPSVEHRHQIFRAVSSLSQIIRQRHDGGPPALRPDTMWRFVHDVDWRPVWNATDGSAVYDKCELLSVLARMGIRPFPFLFNGGTSSDREESHALFFLPTEIESLRIDDNRTRANGRICGAIISLTKLNYSTIPAFQCLIDLTPSRLQELSVMELSNVAYAVGMALVTDPPVSSDVHTKRIELLIAIFRQFNRRRSDVSVSSLNQVGLVHFGLTVCGDTEYLDSIRRNPELELFTSECVRMAESDNINVVTASKAQSVVRQALNQLGLEEFVREEHAIGPFRIDFAIPELKLLIEINGPFHYYYKTTTPTRKTEFKSHVLKSMGYTIIDVGFLEMKDQRNRAQLMEEKIREALELPPGGRLRNQVSKLIQNSTH